MDTPGNRRDFIRLAGLAGTMMLARPDRLAATPVSSGYNPVTIRKVSSDFDREPLIRPFGFKGGYMTEIWQSASWLQGASGRHSIGLCSQNVLWSDASVFAANSESGGNAIMYALTERALQVMKGQTYRDPMELLDQVFPEIYAYGQKITGNPGLRKTFALNALVGPDNAAWLLWAAENDIRDFDSMIPNAYRKALAERHTKAAAIPLMAYAIPVDEIVKAVDQGYFFLKIKLGQPGTQAEMLEKDMARLTAIHKAIGHATTPYTLNGKLPYYFDANGRYEKKETLLRFLDHAARIGALEQIVLVEEPFPEELETDVRDIPVRLASDESAHTVSDAIKRIEMGYGAIALKAIAKTLSMTIKIAAAATERNIPCYCADLTVNPVLVEWNKNVAARLKPFPGLGNIGLIESNGHQNYRNWENMMNGHPARDGAWVRAERGVYQLNREFYQTSGGIFQSNPYWENRFKEI